MIIATIMANLIIAAIVIIAVITNDIKAKKNVAAQGEEKQLICEGIVCNDIITFDNQEDMIKTMIADYPDGWMQDLYAIYFMKKGIIIEYRGGWKVYYTHSA
jgi:hypothetical protein